MFCISRVGLWHLNAARFESPPTAAWLRFTVFGDYAKWPATPQSPGWVFHACGADRGWILRKLKTKEVLNEDRCEQRMVNVMYEMCTSWPQRAGPGWAFTCTLSPRSPAPHPTMLRGHILSYLMRCGDVAANWDLGQCTAAKNRATFKGRGGVTGNKEKAKRQSAFWKLVSTHDAWKKAIWVQH